MEMEKEATGLTQRTAPLSYRALIIGALLIPPNLYWLTLAETVLSTLFTIFYNVTFTLFLLVVLNEAIRRFAPAIALEASELLIVYVMLAIATGIFGHTASRPRVRACARGREARAN
jgi:hypothetical protein